MIKVELFEVDLTVNIPESCDRLSITIWPINHNFLAFFLKYFFVGIYILNKKVQHKQIRKLIDCWIKDQNTFDFK